MGRHTAPIPIVSAPPAALLAGGPVTDPHLFDRPLPGAVRAPVTEGPTGAFGARARRRESAAAPFFPERGDDRVDEIPVAVAPRSVRSVLAAEEAAAAQELPTPRFPRARDLAFGAAALVVMIAAVGAALIL